MSTTVMLQPRDYLSKMDFVAPALTRLISLVPVGVFVLLSNPFRITRFVPRVSVAVPSLTASSNFTWGESASWNASGSLLLEIRFAKRETFAYACEAYGRILAQADAKGDRHSLLNILPRMEARLNST